MEQTINALVKEHGIYNPKYINPNENQNGKIVSIYSLGTHGTKEETTASDQDINVVFRDEYVSVKSSRDKIIKNLEGIKSQTQTWTFGILLNGGFKIQQSI